MFFHQHIVFNDNFYLCIRILRSTGLNLDQPIATFHLLNISKHRIGSLGDLETMGQFSDSMSKQCSNHSFKHVSITAWGHHTYKLKAPEGQMSRELVPFLKTRFRHGTLIPIWASPQRARTLRKSAGKTLPTAL